MIEPTDEMEQAYEKAWQAVASAESVIGCAEHDMGDCPYHEVPGARRRAGLAAVLAIVERDRVVVDPDDLRMVLDQRIMHCHLVPGFWDGTGRPCAECAARTRLRAALDGAS